MNKPTLVFFGTQEFASAILSDLIKRDEYEIQLVVTQPDRPQGRNKNVIPAPVKIIAKEHNIPLIQPESFKEVVELPPVDLFIVCQYGLIIPQAILNIPKKGTLNVHGSLLPHLRGASPIQTALIEGYKETGITIMLMDEKMDHGPILTQKKLPITDQDTSTTLSEKLMPLAAELLFTTIPSWMNNEITPIPQKDAEATFCKLLTRDDGHLDFNKSATQLYNLYRGLTPWPGIWALWGNKRLKLLECTPTSHTYPPGKITVLNNKLVIGCKEGGLEINKLQLEGKKVVDAKAFIQGYPEITSATLL